MDFFRNLKQTIWLGSNNHINIKPLVDSSINAFENGNIAFTNNILIKTIKF